MQLNTRLIANLAIFSATGLLVMLVCTVLAELGLPTTIMSYVGIAGTVAFYIPLLWLWVYWLLYFHRSGRQGEFWLCFVLPYLYSSYRTIRFLRARVKSAA